MGYGIMEEPELTLISSKDISTVESELELFSQEDNKKTENLSDRDHSEIKFCPKVKLHDLSYKRTHFMFVRLIFYL